MTPHLSVVIPVYRSRATLPSLLARVVDCLESTAGRPWEVILVDDGSPDDSFVVLDELARRYGSRVRIGQLTRNFGQHAATLCGISHARGLWVGTLDDDLQYQPEDLLRAWQAAEADSYDLVYGRPRRGNHPPLRRWLSSVGRWLSCRALGTQAHPSSLRVMRGSLAQALAGSATSNPILDGVLLQLTSRVGAVDVDHLPRQQGRSGYTYAKLLSFFFTLLTTYSLLPLRLLGVLGLASVAGGSALAAWALVARQTGPLWAAAALTLLGVQLLTLAIGGEYLGRIRALAHGLPPYVERSPVAARSPGGHSPAAAEEGRFWPAATEPIDA